MLQEEKTGRNWLRTTSWKNP